jgi:hypothetical protein
MLQNLPDRLAVDPEKTSRRTLAQTIDMARTPNPTNYLSGTVRLP